MNTIRSCIWHCHRCNTVQFLRLGGIFDLRLYKDMVICSADLFWSYKQIIPNRGWPAWAIAVMLCPLWLHMFPFSPSQQLIYYTKYYRFMLLRCKRKFDYSDRSLLYSYCDCDCVWSFQVIMGLWQSDLHYVPLVVNDTQRYAMITFSTIQLRLFKSHIRTIMG